MGMPISSYNVVRVLSEGGEPWETSPVEDALKPFNLFAFIIHDPETHSALHEEISQNFTDLDEITGCKLLFFALVDPPKEWSERSRQREYYKSIRGAQELSNPENALTSIDKDITAFILAENLKIPRGALPCLVITSDFRSTDSHLWVRTCAEHVFTQLTSLGAMAKNKYPMHKICDRIDLCEGSGFTVLENSLAKALNDALDFIIAINSPDLNLREQVIRRCEKDLTNTLSNLENKLDMYKKKGPDDEEKFEGLCERIASFLADFNTDNLSRDDFINIDPQFLEDDSNRLLEVAHKAMHLLEKYITNEEEIDYTPGVICLGKAFEREINLSVVNWMRKLYGVELPKYFNQYQPNLVLKDFPDLNREPWRSPDFSKSERIYRSVALNRGPDSEMSLNEEDRKLLGRCWKQIRTQRNKAAHYSTTSPIIERQNFDVVKDAFVELANKKVFDVFSDMKKKYSECDFPDKLRTVISTAIKEKHKIKREHGDPITVVEMKTLKKIDGRDKGICDLTGLEIATELGELDLGRNVIENLSPLQELTNLKTLKLDNNNIENLTPLTELTNLTTLWLNNNNITALDSLTELTNLTTLWLNNNNIENLDPLKELTNELGELDLGRNVIENLSPLQELTNLKILKLDNNNITALDSLENLTNLTTLWLNNNNITALDSLENLTNLTTLWLNNNNIENLDPLKNLRNLQTLRLNNNNIVDISSLKCLNNLTYLKLDGRTVVDHSKLPNNLEYLILGDKRILPAPC